MNGLHSYHLCGFTCASELEIPDVPECNPVADPEVSIRIGRVPDALPSVIDRGPTYEASPDEFLLHLENIGRFYVREGCEIVVQPAPQASDSEIRLFLLGSALGALLHQRGRLPLHASAVKVGDGCVAFVGDSGAGKSTLCAYLNQRGYPFVCDDVCPIEMTGVEGVVHPSICRFKLWAQSVQALDIGADSVGPQVRKELEKFEVPAQQRYLGPGLPLTRVYLLREARDYYDEGIESLTGPNRLQKLLENTYRFRFLKGLGRKREHFQACATLLNSVSIRYLTRNWGLDHLSKTVDLLEAELQELVETSSSSQPMSAVA